MEVILAGGLASLIAYAINTMLMKAEGNRILPYLVPVVEETCKTLSAVWLGAPVLFVHLFFGAAEGLFDLLTVDPGGWLPALSSLITHGMLGTLTTWGIHKEGLPFGLLTGIVAHVIWNNLIIRLVTARRKNP